MENKKRLQEELKLEYLQQMKRDRDLRRQERQEDQFDQKLRIEQAHQSLDRDRVEQLRKKDRYVEQLHFYGGQKQAERMNEKMREQMLMHNDINNIESYV